MAKDGKERGIMAPRGNWREWIEGGTFHADDLEPGLRLRNCQVDLADMEEPLDEICFDNCSFSESGFRKLTLRDAAFSRCELALCDFTESGLYRVAFADCRLAGANFTRSSLREVNFESCLLDYASFGSSKIQHLRFGGGRMREGSLQDVKWEDLRWEGITIDGTDISDSLLRNMDLSKCEFSNIRISAHLAEGLCIRSDQAPSLISAFGVNLVD